MKKIILYIAASLDQRIAEPDGGLDWLSEFQNAHQEKYEFSDLLASVSTVIMGGRAYRELLIRDLLWSFREKQICVVSRNERDIRDAVRYITENIIEAVEELRKQADKDILLIGGGEMVSLLLAADLIDEMKIVYIPLILGNGIPLFPGQPKETKWKLTESKKFENNVLIVKYQKE